MPRKQRFKPSRKPKPIITAQADGTVNLDGSSTEFTDMPRTSDADPAASAADVRVSPSGDKAEAR
jgi:hypothetical protein